MNGERKPKGVPGSGGGAMDRRGHGTWRLWRANRAALRVACLFFVFGLGVAASSDSNTPAETATRPANRDSDILQFLDGATLHGQLNAMDTEKGVEWRHPAARGMVRFRPDNLASIRFEKARPVMSTSKASCRFEFANGDEVFGALKSLDSEAVQLEAWFGGDLRAPKTGLQSLTFFPNGFAILYEGPNGPDGWKMDRGPRGWQYRDGAFVTSSVGILGRDLKLTGPCSLEFDLSWTGHFSLSFILYAESVDRFDYSQNSYMFHLAPGYLNVQRVQSGVGVTSIGQAQIPDMLRKGKLRLQIRTNREDSSLGVWADGILIQKWKDHAGLQAKGSGVVFSSQMDGPQIRLYNIKVTEWDGAMEPPVVPTKNKEEDIVYLVNRDKVIGKLHGVREGKLLMGIAQSTLEIPVARVTQVYLARSDEQTYLPRPWEIRVEVAGGGRVSMELSEWTNQRIAGRSPNFGLLAFHPESVRQIQFNPARTVLAPGTSENPAVDKWEFDE